MIRNYTVTSPSLEGVLRHASLEYSGVERPLVVSQIFDRPGKHMRELPDDLEKQKIVEQYFHDLYGILIKRLSAFAMEADPSPEESIKLLAMLQELVNVKKLLATRVLDAHDSKL